MSLNYSKMIKIDSWIKERISLSSSQSNAEHHMLFRLFKKRRMVNGSIPSDRDKLRNKFNSSDMKMALLLQYLCSIVLNLLYTRSISTGRFRPENFRTFSGDFRPVPVGTHRKLTGIHRKKSGPFPVFSRRIRWPESSTWDMIIIHPIIH